MKRNLLGEDDAEPSWCEWMNVVLYFRMRIFLNVCRFFPDGYRPVLVSHRGRGMADVERIRGVRVSLTQTFRSRFARRFVSVRKGAGSRLLSNLQAMFDRLDLPSFEKTVELRASKSVAAIIDDITPRSFKILRLDTVCPTDSWVLLPDLAYHPPKKNSRGSTVATAEITLSGSGAKKGNFLHDRNGAVGAESSAADSGRSGDSCRFLNPFREHNKMLELWKGRLFCTRMCEETSRILLPLQSKRSRLQSAPDRRIREMHRWVARAGLCDFRLFSCDPPVLTLEYLKMTDLSRIQLFFVAIFLYLRLKSIVQN